MRFLTIFVKFCTWEKFQNHKTTKLNTCQVWDSLFPNIWSGCGFDTRISHISSYRNKIGVSVTYLITITLINDRKLIFNETSSNLTLRSQTLTIIHEIFQNIYHVDLLYILPCGAGRFFCKPYICLAFQMAPGNVLCHYNRHLMGHF